MSGTDELTWYKSSRSSEHGDNCVELAALAPGVAVRDSKRPYGLPLAFSRTAFRSFAQAVLQGRYDL